MRFRAAACIALLIAGACAKRDDTAGDASAAAKPAVAANAAEWPLSFDRIGAIVVGSTLRDTHVMLDQPVSFRAGDPEACQMVRPAGAPAGVTLMVLRDTIQRIDVDSAGVSTREGVGIGASEAGVDSAYGGRVLTEAHKYLPKGHTLVVDAPGDSTRRILFETDGKKVLRFRAGRRSAVDLVEKCS